MACGDFRGVFIIILSSWGVSVGLVDVGYQTVFGFNVDPDFTGVSGGAVGFEAPGFVFVGGGDVGVDGFEVFGGDGSAAFVDGHAYGEFLFLDHLLVFWGGVEVGRGGEVGA